MTAALQSDKIKWFLIWHIPTVPSLQQVYSWAIPGYENKLLTQYLDSVMEQHDLWFQRQDLPSFSSPFLLSTNSCCNLTR